MSENGVRMKCPQCTLDCVMHAEGEMPAKINKLVEGVPWCPNCNMPMEPAGSVPTNGTVLPFKDPGAGPSPGLGEGLPLAERLAKIREAEREVATAKAEWEEAKSEASDAKKVYDGKVVTLCTLIERLTSVTAPKPLPLFDAPPADGPCGSVGPVDALPCTLAAGHEGPHVNEPTGDGVRDVVTGELIEELSRLSVSWPNEAEAMAPVINSDVACLAMNGDEVCTRTKGHTGPHIKHSIVGDVGQELARWPQAAPQDANDATAEVETTDAAEAVSEPQAREDEALPLPGRRRKKRDEAHA